MAQNNLPRLLLVDGTPLSRITNMGILKTNLLSNYPKDQVVQISTSGINDDSSANSHIKYLISLRSVIFGTAGKLIEYNNNKEKIDYQVSNKNDLIGSYLKRKFPIFFDDLSQLVRLRNTVYHNKLYTLIKEFKPNFILTFGVTISELYIANKISSQFDLPVIIYVPDDYIEYNHTKHSIFSKFLRNKLKKTFRDIVYRSKMRFVVSELMKVEYEKRYGLQFNVLMDGIDPNYYKDSNHQSLKNDFTLTFLGSLEPSRWMNLALLGNALDIINNEGEHKCSLEIYSFNSERIKYKDHFTALSINLKEEIPFENVPIIQKNSDILIHVECFPPFVHNNQTKYSMSTKIIQYLASGTPILAFGPNDVASIRFLKEFESTTIITTNDLNDIVASIKELLSNVNIKISKAQVNRVDVLSRYSIENISREFNESLCKLWH